MVDRLLGLLFAALVCAGSAHAVDLFGHVQVIELQVVHECRALVGDEVLRKEHGKSAHHAPHRVHHAALIFRIFDEQIQRAPRIRRAKEATGMQHTHRYEARRAEGTRT